MSIVSELSHTDKSSDEGRSERGRVKRSDANGISSGASGHGNCIGVTAKVFLQHAAVALLMA